MSKKIALITDLHFGSKSDSKAFHSFFENFYLNFFFPYIAKNNINFIIMLGDFFERRKFINYETLALAKKVFLDVARDLNIEVLMICGNHDCYFKTTNSRNSLDLIAAEYENVTVLSNPTEYTFAETKFLMLPWLNQENINDAVNLLRNSSSKFVMSHLELAGFDWGNNVISEKSQIDKDLLIKYNRVFSGHFHKRSVESNIHYLGSPYHMNWGDYGDKRGFHVFDAVNDEIEFVEYKDSPFVKFIYDDSQYSVKDLEKFINDPETFGDLSNKFVKVCVTSKKHQIQYEMFIEKIELQSYADLKIDDETAFINEYSITPEDFEKMTTENLIIEFVDNALTTDLDKEILKKRLLNLYSEASKSLFSGDQ